MCRTSCFICWWERDAWLFEGNPDKHWIPCPRDEPDWKPHQDSRAGRKRSEETRDVLIEGKLYVTTEETGKLIVHFRTYCITTTARNKGRVLNSLFKSDMAVKFDVDSFRIFECLVPGGLSAVSINTMSLSPRTIYVSMIRIRRILVVAGVTTAVEKIRMSQILKWSPLQLYQLWALRLSGGTLKATRSSHLQLVYNQTLWIG